MSSMGKHCAQQSQFSVRQKHRDRERHKKCIIMTKRKNGCLSCITCGWRESMHRYNAGMKKCTDCVSINAFTGSPLFLLLFCSTVIPVAAVHLVSVLSKRRLSLHCGSLILFWHYHSCAECLDNLTFLCNLFKLSINNSRCFLFLTFYILFLFTFIYKHSQIGFLKMIEIYD